MTEIYIYTLHPRSPTPANKRLNTVSYDRQICYNCFDKGDYVPNRSRNEYTLTPPQPIFQEFFRNYIIEGRLLRFSPHVQERPQDQISWVRQMAAKWIEPRSGVSLEVGEDGVRVHRREAAELLDGKHYYDTSESTIKYYLSSHISTKHFVPIPIGGDRITRLYQDGSINALYYYQPVYQETSADDLVNRLQRVPDDVVCNIRETPPRSGARHWRAGAGSGRGRGLGDEPWRPR